MFLKQTLVSALLLTSFAVAIAMGMLFFSHVPTEAKLETLKMKPFQQTKIDVRRDIYGQRAQQPAHTILRCFEAELSYDMLANDLVEHMRGVQGMAFHQGLQDIFSADIATYSHQQHQITASAAKGARFKDDDNVFAGHADYTKIWLNPEGLIFTGQNVHVQDGNKTPFTLDSHKASYNGTELYLDGQVAIGLPTGSLLADKAQINPDTLQGNFTGHLTVLMPSGGELQADHCHVDRNKGTATFTAANKVSYHDPNFEGRKPLDLTCHQLTIHAPLNAHEMDIHQIVAQGEVEALYDEGWELSADRAIYDNDSEKRLTLETNKRKGCVVTTPYNDVLVAKRIESTLLENRATFYEVTGELRDGLTTVYADEASWDHLASTLTCHKETRIQNQQHGNLKAQGELHVTFLRDDGALSLATAHHEGSLDVQGTEKQLFCQGDCFLDHQNKQITLASEENKAVKFVDTMGELDARKLHICYDWLNSNFTTTKLKAEEDVHLQRAHDGAIQVALADDMEYLPDQDKVTLRARPPKRVLFYDPTRQMTASAKGVDIVRDPFTHKISLQGKGDVQFKLMEAELQAMRQYLQGIKNGKK